MSLPPTHRSQAATQQGAHAAYTEITLAYRVLKHTHTFNTVWMYQADIYWADTTHSHTHTHHYTKCVSQKIEKSKVFKVETQRDKDTHRYHSAVII